MNPIIEKIRAELLLNFDEKTRLQGERYFKEKIKLLGVKTAVVTSIGREIYNAIPDKSKLHIFHLCEELFETEYLEESGVACMWSYNVRKQYTVSDFETFEKWVNSYVTNWAVCDTFCNHSVGAFIEMYPEFMSGLKKWAVSENRWVKRASAVSLIVPARKGKFLKEILEIADILHADRDDMVQKGYGWMLKSASKAYQKEIFEYVMERKATMPRTSLRYAIEKMPQELKAKAMAK